MTHKTSKNVVLAFLSVIMCFALFLGIGFNFNSKQAQAESVEPKSYVVESLMHTANDAFHICNDVELTKGDTFTLTYTVSYINAINNTLPYRYGKVCEYSDKDSCWNGNTNGATLWMGGKNPTYATLPLLPWTNGMEIKVVFTPNGNNDTYGWVYYENGTQVDQGGNRAFYPYMGILIQGYTHEMMLTNVTFASETTDYGIYTYTEKGGNDYSTVMASENVSDLAVVEAKDATCSTVGCNTHVAYTYNGEAKKFLYSESAINADAHNLENNVCTLCGVDFNEPTEPVEAKSYIVESSMAAVNDAFHICNDLPLKKGDAFTLEFTVYYIKNTVNTGNFRFAWIIEDDAKDTCWNAAPSYAGAGCNMMAGNPVSAASHKVLPWSNGTKIKIEFTPDATGDNYAWTYYQDGVQLDTTGTASRPFQEYMGLMIQGFKYDFILSDVTFASETKDYGVYAYAEKWSSDYATTMASENVSDLAIVEAKDATCSTVGYNTHVAYTYNGEAKKFLYTESAINADAHNLENNVCTLCGENFGLALDTAFVVESSMHTVNDAFHICNDVELTKGDTFTLEFTVFYNNNISNTNKYRFAKICEYTDKTSCWNGNTNGAALYFDGKWVQNGTTHPILPWRTGMTVKVVFTPNENGDTYNWVYYENGTQIASDSNRAFNPYMGILIQGFTYDFILSNVSFKSETKNYGVYAYAEESSTYPDYATTMNSSDVTGLTLVEDKDATCVEAGYSEHVAYTYNNEAKKFLYVERAIDPEAHHLEGTCLDSVATCKLCGETTTTQIPHEFVESKCSVCGLFLAEIVKEYSVDIKNLTEEGDTVYISNAMPLKKGDTMVITFNVASVTKYDQEAWLYRFAKVCNSNEIGNIWDGNTSGANLYLSGEWANYANTPLLPLEVAEYKLIVMPKDEAGDFYCIEFYMNGNRIDNGGNMAYTSYFGIMMQGWRFELSLVNVTCYGDATDYGVYAYPVGEDVDYKATTTDNGYFTYYGVEVTVNGENGTFVSEKSYKDGAQGVVTFIPEKGYKIGSLKLNGQDITSEVLTDHGLNIFDYKFTAQQDMNFVVSFEKDEEFKIAYYDYYDISGGNTKFEVTATTTIYRLGTMPATSNVAFIAYLDLGSQFGISSESGRQIGFLQDASNPLWTAYGFEFALRPAGGMVRFKGAPGGNYDRYFDYTMAVGGETILFEVGVYDINETEGMFYFYINGTLIMYEKYDKAGYAISTGVGGFYTTYQTDVDGGIYVRTAYETSEIKFAENYEGVSLYKSQYAVAGKEVSVLAEKGYVINGMKVNGVAVDYTANGSVYTFVMAEVPENFVLELEVAYIEKNITITYNAEQVSVTAPEKVAVRDDATVVIKPASGYVIKTVKVNGQDVTAQLVAVTGGMKLDLVNVTEDTAVEVIMAVKTYAITVTADENVTVTAPATVGANESVTFTIETAEGYRVKKMTVNGKVVYPNADGNYVIDSVTEDINFVVVSEAIPVIDDNVPTATNSCFASISSFGLISTLCAFACGTILLKKKKD